jgi:hypothetical protein
LLRAYTGSDSPEAADRVKGELEKIEEELQGKVTAVAPSALPPQKSQPMSAERFMPKKDVAEVQADPVPESAADESGAAPFAFDVRFVILMAGTAAVLGGFRILMSRKVRGVKAR